MSHKVYFRPEAAGDLLALYTYISQRSGNLVAARYLSRIETACLNLSTFPTRGVPRNDLTPGIRLLNFERRVTIAYLVEGQAVRVARVFYAGRDFESELLERDDD